MNKPAPDSALMPEGLPRDLAAAGWGHALADMREGLKSTENKRQSLATILGQLPANACHEVLAAGKADAASLFGFGIMLAMMLAGDAPCFLIREQRRGDGALLYPPGLAQLGLEPDRCFSVHAPDLLAALRAAADIARSDAAGAVLVEVDGNPRLLDLTASRRLALAAEKSGTAVLLLRSGAREAPSAAYSRWQVRSALSTSPALAADEEKGLGFGPPAFAVTLLRHRRMAAGMEARLIWNVEERRFDEQSPESCAESDGKAASGRLAALAARRAAGARAHRAA